MVCCIIFSPVLLHFHSLLYYLFLLLLFFPPHTLPFLLPYDYLLVSPPILPNPSSFPEFPPSPLSLCVSFLLFLISYSPSPFSPFHLQLVRASYNQQNTQVTSLRTTYHVTSGGIGSRRGTGRRDDVRERKKGKIYLDKQKEIL